MDQSGQISYLILIYSFNPCIKAAHTSGTMWEIKQSDTPSADEGHSAG